MMHQRLLIATVTEQRSGSKWLGSLLRQTLGVGSLGEAFFPTSSSIVSFANFVKSKGFEHAQDVGHRVLLDEYFSDLSVFFGNAMHFDVMFNQKDWITFGWCLDQYPVYDYLRNRDAVVISLNRSPREIFLSQKALDIIKIPHFFNKSDMDSLGSAECLHRLSVDDYNYFCRRLEFNRETLREAMKGYRDFVEIDYSDIESCGTIPQILIDTISNAAREKGIGLLGDGRLDLLNVPMKPSMDYNTLFENASDIE